MLTTRLTHSTTRWYLPNLEVRVESSDSHLQHELEDCLRGWFFRDPVSEAAVPRLSIYAQCSASAPVLPEHAPFADLGKGVKAWDRSVGAGARHVLVSDGRLSAEISVVGDGLTALLCASSVVDESNDDRLCDFVETLLSLLLPRVGYIPLPACEATAWGGERKHPQSLIVLGRPAARRDVVSALYRDGWRATPRTQVFLTRDESGKVIVLGGELQPAHYRPSKVVRLLSASDRATKVSPAWMRAAEVSERLLGSPRPSSVGARLDELLEKTGGVTDVNWKEDHIPTTSGSLEKILKRRGKANTSAARPGERFRGFRHRH